MEKNHCSSCHDGHGEPFFITTAIAYASRMPHIGNVYEAIFTDAIARYKRSRGYDVFFLTGTDEHGQKIEDIARAEGVSPKEYVDRVASDIRGLWDRMNISYDHFIRTTDAHHEAAVQKIFRRLYDQGDIYKDSYEGWYCVPCESFLTETQVEDGKCPDCGAPVRRAKEEAYSFRMSKYADRLLEYIESHPGFIEPVSRQKEMINNFIKPGLQDLCVSRSSFKWGIPVDFDEGHVVYVWLDALTNYITALGYTGDGNNGANYAKYWPADIHVIGKDIMRFHSIYWPIFLMALGEPLPKKVFGHPWLLFGEDKMSKSKGNVLYADDLARHFTVDGVRHYVLSEMPYASDGSITYESLIGRYNADLANNLGNLVKRTVDMTGKYFGGVIQSPNAAEPIDDELRAAVRDAVSRSREQMDSYHVADASKTVFGLFRRANKYIDETIPWVLAKDESRRERLGTVLYNLLETIRIGAVLLAPFMPDTSKRILAQLATDEQTVEFGALKAGDTLAPSEVLFARIDEKAITAELQAEAERAAAAAAAKKAAEDKTTADASGDAGKKQAAPEGCALIGIDDFSAVELRTAQVLSAEPVPKAKKLLCLQLDLGYEKRQVVSGIAKFYTPEQLVGKKVIIVANLRPAKLCGVESNGMILASGEETVRVVFLDPETPLGERVR